MKRTLAILTSALATLAILALSTALVYAQVGGGFDLSFATIAGGGGTSSGGVYSLDSTIGQPAAGSASGGAYSLDGGFLGGATGLTPASTPTGTPTHTPTGTNTNTPTATPSRTRTNTPTNTNTSTSTRTNTPASTATAIPTGTSTITRTNTPTITFTRTATVTPAFTSSHTPTTTPTSTPTGTPASAGVIIGHLTWQGIGQPDTRNIGGIGTFIICVAGVGQSHSAYTDASGFFTVTTGLPNGTYYWTFKGQINLANVGTATINAEGRMQNAEYTGFPPERVHSRAAGSKAPNLQTTSVEMGLMRAGDANDDNIVDIVDFNTLKVSFGRSFGDPGYDASADFDRSETVDVFDFNLLKGNFGQSGSVLGCP